MRIQIITFCTAVLLSVFSITHAASFQEGSQLITFVSKDQNNADVFVSFQVLSEAVGIMNEIEKMVPRNSSEIRKMYTDADKNNDHVIDGPEAISFHYTFLVEQVTSEQSRRVFTLGPENEKSKHQAHMIFQLFGEAVGIMNEVERMAPHGTSEIKKMQWYMTADKNHNNVIDGPEAKSFREWFISNYQEAIKTQ